MINIIKDNIIVPYKVYNNDSILIQDDCFNIFELIPDKSIDFIFSDIPYGTTFCKWDTILPFNKYLQVKVNGKNRILYKDESILELCKQGMLYNDVVEYFNENGKDGMWESLNRIIKDNGAIVLFSQQPFTSKLINSNIQNFKYQLVWKKEKPSNVFNVKYQFGRIHEDICVFYKNQPTYNPQMNNRKVVTNPKPMKGDLNIDISKNVSGVYKHSKTYNPNLTYPTSVLEFNRDSKKGTPALHPTQKPIALIEYLITTFSNENDMILDFTMGSGTTCDGAKNLNRKFIGIEKEEKYYNIAVERCNENYTKTNNDIFEF